MSTVSFVPISDRPWDASTPDRSVVDCTYGHQDSPDANNKNLEIGLCVCHVCNKQYFRYCDLNKHLKTHSRSFKCPVKGCRYNTFGWPTEKELERHHNDKHSAAPKVFSCLYYPCTYTSKRESNCKQHMEKAHGWEYIRSRAGNREESSSTAEIAPHGDTIFVSDRPALDLNINNVPGFLLTPSPLGQRPPTPQDGFPLPLGLNETFQYVPSVYGPWTSPVTPLGNHEPFLGATDQACDQHSRRPTPSDELLKIPVDPRLCQPNHYVSRTTAAVHDLPVTTGREAMRKSLPTIETAQNSPVVKSQVLTPSSDLSPALFPTTVPYRKTIGTGDSESGPIPGIPTTQPLSTRSASRKADGKRLVRFSHDSDNDSDEDEEPPNKRNKGPGEDEDGGRGDPKLICPFRAEHPEIYKRDVDPKYASCHTEHLNISTVVRHLGRPAHNLEVDNSRSAISSFDIVDPEYNHAAAGLCKRCWTQFDDRQAFDEHFKSRCSTRSRSKREKFDLIRDTFCHLRSDVVTRDGSSDKDKPREDEDMNTATDSHRLDAVSRHEFVGLVQRVAALEQILATRMPRSTPRVVPQQAQTVVRAFSSSPALPSSQASHPYGFYSYNDGAGSSRAVSGNEMETLGQQVVERGAQAGHYNDNQSSISGFGLSVPSRPDSVLTLRQESSPAMPGGPPQQRQRFGGTNNHQRAEVPVFNPAAAAMPIRDTQARVGTAAGDQIQLAGNQGEGFGVEQPSQESTNTAMRNQWDHAVQVGEEMLGRGIDFFNNPGDDLSKFLDMEPQ